MGPSVKGGIFALGLGEDLLNMGGTCQGPFFFSNPTSPSTNPKPKEKDSGSATLESGGAEKGFDS